MTHRLRVVIAVRISGSLKKNLIFFFHEKNSGGTYASLRRSERLHKLDVQGGTGIGLDEILRNHLDNFWNFGLNEILRNHLDKNQ